MKLMTVAGLAALGALSAGASAQQKTDLTLYGIVGAGVQRVSPRSIDGAAAAGTTQLVSGYTSANRFGLRGSENLGGGTRAVFNLEGGFSIDDGVSSLGGRLFGREASAGLATPVGTVAAGRFAVLSSGTGTYNLYNYSPFGVSWGEAGMKLAAYANARVDNAVVYRSPKRFGFTGSAMYSFRADGTELAGSDANRRFGGAGATFDAGKLSVGLIYETYEAARTETVPDESALTIGASYDFGAAVAYLTWQRHADAPIKGAMVGSGAAARAVIADADLLMVGAKINVPGGALLASWQVRDGKSVTVSGLVYEGDAQVFGLGYQYLLSSRTYLYAAHTLNVGDKSWSDTTEAGRGMATAATRGAYNQRVTTAGLYHRF
jgi:predicted porin